jgi:hypothetical protein
MKETIRNTKRRWVHSTEMDLGQMGLSGMDWILAQDRGQWKAL